MIFLWGMNTGAAAGVLHLGQALDPDAVSGIVIDSVFSSFDIALKEALSRSQKKGRIGIPTFVGKGAAAIVLRSVRKKLGYDSGEFTTSRLSPLEYAKRNNFEAFAEAFVSWCWPGNGYDHPDPATVALFDSLAEGGW